MFPDIVVVVEFENVHGENHSDEVAKGFCAYGRRRVVAGIYNCKKCRQASIPSLCGILV